MNYRYTTWDDVPADLRKIVNAEIARQLAGASSQQSPDMTARLVSVIVDWALLSVISDGHHAADDAFGSNEW